MKKGWWLPRPTGDPGTDRRAVAIHVGCLVLLFTVTLALTRAMGRERDPQMLPLVFTELIVVSALACNYSAKCKWAARLTTFGFLLGSAFLVAVAQDGIRSISILGFPGALIVGVILFDGVEYVVLVISTLATLTALGLADLSGMIGTVPTRSPTDPYTILYIDLIVGTIAVFGGLSARNARLNMATLRATIDQLAQSESALRESEQRFRSLSDASFEGIMIHDHGIILDANQAFIRLFGYETLDELAGKNGPDLLLTAESRARVRQRMATQDEGIIELTGVRKDGAPISADTESRPMKYMGRNARLVAWRDTTERRRAEREKAIMEAQLHQAQKMESIGRLAGGIAHDFNNLLTVINGYSSALSAQLEGSLQRYAEQIRMAGEFAANLTSQLLTFGRMEAPQNEIVHVNHIVTETKDMLERLVGEHIQMKTHLVASQDRVHADSNRIRQCLMNLVVNARDAMPYGGLLTIETANVDVSREDLPAGNPAMPGPHIRLTVTDTGIGMDDDTKSRVFEPFFTTKESGRGVGLGLATVHGIVGQWRGFIKVETGKDQGSRFSVFLPQDKRVEAARGISDRPVVATQEISATLLVVEDQEIVREFVAESLRICGYSVLEASNGNAALGLMAQNPDVGLVMTDLMMPGMKGGELAARVKELYPLVKILFMTGYSDDSTSIGGLSDAVSHIIMKPFTPKELAAKVRDLLNLR